MCQHASCLAEGKRTRCLILWLFIKCSYKKLIRSEALPPSLSLQPFSFRCGNDSGHFSVPTGVHLWLLFEQRRKKKREGVPTLDIISFQGFNEAMFWPLSILCCICVQPGLAVKHDFSASLLEARIQFKDDTNISNNCQNVAIAVVITRQYIKTCALDIKDFKDIQEDILRKPSVIHTPYYWQ